MLLGRRKATNTSDSKTNSDETPQSCSLSVNESLYVFTDLGAFTLIAQGATTQTELFLQNQLDDVVQVLRFYLGGFVNESSDPQIIQGAFQYVDYLLGTYVSGIRSLVQGNHWMFLEDEARQSVDGLLASLEEDEHISSSMLIQGGSVLHSRLPPSDTSLLQQNIQANPLGTL